MSLVTVVIPAYNAERTVGQAIESVLAQSFSDLEIRVIDDGSTDGTATAASAYGHPVECRSTPNRGVSEARNYGIAEAEGDFVAFLDADDLWEQDKLERQLQLLQANPDAGICTTGSRRVDEDLRTLEETPAWKYADPGEALLLYSNVLGSMSSPLVRRELALEVGFDPRFSQCADWDFLLQMSLRTSFAVIPDPLVLYRISPHSMSSDIELLERDTFAVLDQFFSSEIPPRYSRLKRRSYSNHWMILSGSYLHAGQPGAAIRCMAYGLKRDPRNVRRPLGLPIRWLRRATSAGRGA